MKLNSHNEWDRLRAVVVGTVEGFVPGLETSDASAGVLEQAHELAMEAYPQWYLDEVAEDLEDLCAVFHHAGIIVLRPKWRERDCTFRTPNWQASGFDIYNVRDLHIVFGDILVASASASRFRLFESYAFHEIFYSHFFAEGFRWIAAPPPGLRGEYLREIERQRSGLEHKEDSLHKQLSRGLNEIFHYLDEDEILFDAANIIRIGRDVIFLVSSTANRKAAAWLQNVLAPEYRLHITNAYRSSHLDSTILPLCPGLVLLNGARVSEATCPLVFDGWDKLYFTDVAPLPEGEVEFHQRIRVRTHAKLVELGVHSQLAHISSPWAGLNVLSLDPRTVLVHDRQIGLIRLLEGRGLDVIPIRMRHCYSMLGGLHCTTLDVVRDSTL